MNANRITAKLSTKLQQTSHFFADLQRIFINHNENQIDMRVRFVAYCNDGFGNSAG
jgi:hypothetical protein